MFPVNSIFDKALQSVRSSIEEQIYSTLSSHLKDYEGPAEDFTDRYGEITDADFVLSKPVYDGIGQTLYDNHHQGIEHCKEAFSYFPKRKDIWIIHYSNLYRCDSSMGCGEINSMSSVILIDNYGHTHIINIADTKRFNKTDIIIPSESELIVMPRLNNSLIDLVKKSFPKKNGWFSYHTTGGYQFKVSALGNSMETRDKFDCITQYSMEKICIQIREIAAYHHRLYGLINALKKENAALKAKEAPNYMDDLLGLEGK